jgi:hypothetical protein
VDKISIATPNTLTFTRYKVLNLPCNQFKYQQIGSDHFPVVATIELWRAWKRSNQVDEGILLSPAPWNEVLTMPSPKKVPRRRPQGFNRLSHFGMLQRRRRKKKRTAGTTSTMTDALRLGLAKRRHAVAGEDDFAAGFTTQTT